MKILSAVVFLLLLSSPAQAGVAQDATKEYCTCAKPLLTEAHKMMESVKSGKMTDMQGVMNKLEVKMVAVEGCFKKLREKYAAHSDDSEFTNAVEAEIQKQCPPPKLGIPLPTQ